MMGQEDFAVQWPASSIFQLATRSSTRSSRCIPAGLEQGARICQSSIMLDRICSQQSTVTGSSCNPSGPIVKESSSVSSSPGDAGGLSTTNFSTRWSVVESDRDNPSASHVACLRKKYRNDYLTTEASELMLVSWRTKSFQSYNFLFGKWARWCTHNPISIIHLTLPTFWLIYMKQVTNTSN